jgi:hypothetical protein
MRAETNLGTPMRNRSGKLKTKKERELFFLERVRSVYSAFPVGEISQFEEPNFPDSIIGSGSFAVGIELVDYIREQNSSGSRLRRYEKIHEKVVSRAKNEFERIFQIPLSVHLHWFHHKELGEAEADRLATEIAELVTTIIPDKAYEGVSIEPYEVGAIDYHITRLSVTRLRSSAKGGWSSVEAGFVEVDVNEFQALISSKDSKIDAYQRNCDSVWLLIVADGRYISSNAEIRNSVRQYSFESRFAKILFYDAASNCVVELSNNTSA